MTAKVICITNQKGGVGKPTTAISVAHGLARKGKQVLLIDLDPQGQAAVALGMTPEPGAYWLLAAGQTPQEQRMVRQCVITSYSIHYTKLYEINRAGLLGKLKAPATPIINFAESVLRRIPIIFTPV